MTVALLALLAVALALALGAACATSGGRIYTSTGWHWWLVRRRP